MVDLTDGVIKLRPFTLDDTEAHLAADDEENIKWLNSGHKSTFESVRNWILKNQKFWENDGPVFAFAVVLASENKLVGAVEANTDYRKFERFKEEDVNISYMVHPFARRKGYAIRAVLLILKFLKDRRYKRAIININKANEKSLGVPIRCEFSKTENFIDKDGNEMIEFVKELTGK
ncbi:GNAT family N-acetyltransferase [Candidatus Gottesmanbacteria bacterium]|nr:GNAT family N-acetyltransferase [Candidatus Gottesmanbacteria bacterium]